MVQPITKMSNAENVLANSLEKTGASVEHIAENIATGNEYSYNEENNEQSYDSSYSPVYSNYQNNTTNASVDMAKGDDMNLTTNMLKLVTSATAYKATAHALKSVSDTQTDIIRNLIGTNQG